MFYRYVSFCSEQTVNYFIFRRAFPFLKLHIAVVTLHSIILKKEIYFRQIQEEFIYLIPRVTKKKKKKKSESYILETEIFWWIKEGRYGAGKIKPKKESTEISKFTD